MDERRRVTTVRQLELLVEFLENHRDLALGRVRSKEARTIASRLWGECAEILNAEGPARTAKEWAKVWNDQKCRVRTKLVSINASQRGTGGGPSNAPSLTALEERIANILGRDVGPLPNVSQDQFIPNDGGNLEQVDEGNEILPEMQEIGALIELSPNETGTQEHQEAITSPVPSLTGQVPTTPTGPDRSRVQQRRVRINQPPTQRPTRSRIVPASALEESRAMILQIERIKAEVALNNSAAFRQFAQSLQVIAGSIDRLSEKLCQREDARRGE